MEEGGVMNLIESMMEPFVYLNRVKVDDSVGGYKDEYQEGVKFDAAVIKNTSTQAVIAEKNGISEIFTIVVNKTLSLEYHDVIKRLSDGAIFRVTSNTVDSTAPVASTVPIAKVTAERWVLPT
jgi:hypothetical protein